MMTPTKAWTFDEIYSIEVLDGNQLNAKVLIDWTCGQSLYDRSCLDMLAAMEVLAENGWTVSACKHGRIGEIRVQPEPGMRVFSIVNQFVDESEAWKLAEEFKGILKDLSGLPS